MAQIKEGESIPLKYQSALGTTNLFPQAFLTDSTGTPLGASPVDLAHNQAGEYTDYSVNMPNVRAVTVQYIPYTDAGHTTISESDGIGTATFELSVLDQDLIDLLIELRDLLDEILSAGISVVGANVTGQISDPSEMKAQVSETSALEGTVSDDEGKVLGEVDDETVSGNVSDVQDLKGDIND
jgi:hypothetical protein